MVTTSNIDVQNSFTFDVIKETEKAVYAKVPYWKPTPSNKPKHEQLFFECWIPKTVLESDYYKLLNFVMRKKDEHRRQNAHQNRMPTPDYYHNMGQYAPEKVCEERVIVDQDKLRKVVRKFTDQFGTNDMVYLMVHQWNKRTNQPLSEEDLKLVAFYYQASKHMDDPRIPTVKIKLYK